MRKIKFRLWDTEEKCFMNHSRVIESRVLVLENNGEGRFIFQQWTGLLDRQGREIYEGDIMRYRDSYDCSTESGYDFEEFLNVGQVIYNEEKARFDITNKSDIGYDDWIEMVSECEIIGNIYENTELLEETK